MDTGRLHVAPEAVKQSRKVFAGRSVQSGLTRIGQRLRWHGALSVDYIYSDGTPYYIDGNPRLVEPMSASLAGVDLVGLLLDVSAGKEEGRGLLVGRPGVRTRLAMQAILGTARASGSRLSILRELVELAAGRGRYRNATEELTPVRTDALSAVPLVATALIALYNPRLAASLPSRGWGAQLLTYQSADAIRDWPEH